MSEDLHVTLQMYRAWKKEAGGWIEQGAEQFFRGVPVRQLEEMERRQAQEQALRDVNTKAGEIKVSEEDNVCSQCGGIKRVDWTISFEECRPVEMRFEPASLAGNWRLCPGHPEPVRKHDGILDARSQYFRYVLLTNEGDRQVVIMDNTFDGFGITPAQALSLLAWLKQEESELQRLAKEQEG